MGLPLTDDDLGKPSSNRRIKLSLPAPVLMNRQGELALEEKVFPVQPFPNSRLSSLAHGSEDEVPTDREIRRIYEAPTWKRAFTETPVIVPMTEFFEPVYWGSEKGTVQAFSIPGEEVFFAAGLLIQSRVPKASSLNAFTLLTHTATAQMRDYHHRLVVLLEKKAAKEYLEPMSAKDRFEFLIENRYTRQLSVSKDRTMAKGWEKRVSAQEAKLKREEAYLESLKSESIEG